MRGFRLLTDIWALLGCYVAHGPTSKVKLKSLTFEDWTDSLTRNVAYTFTVLRCVKFQKRAKLQPISLGRANDHHNEVFPLVCPYYHQHTILIQDRTACFKILTHRQNRVISKIYFISLKN